jgi:protein O-GlcNAcase/histone acetyltransferase
MRAGMNLKDGHFYAGVVEGFYGRPWNPRQRHQLFCWLQAGGLNTYLYAPKDDLKHRACWRERYNEAESAELAGLIRDARSHGLDFLYGLAPGLDIAYRAGPDVTALRDKVMQLVELGCHQFAILFDDIPSALSAADLEHFGSAAGAQCAVTNALFRFVRERVPDTRFLFCPTVYCGRMAQPTVSESAYLRELGERLTPEIQVLWTGPEIISETISVESIREVSPILRRRPVIWDNLYANDYDMRRLYLGPYAGRPHELRTEVAGILANPNCQFEANFVPLRTLAGYLAADQPRPAREAYLEGLRAWLSMFQDQAQPPNAVTLADLEWLGDLFYLPFEFGLRAQRFLDDFKQLQRLPPEAWGETQARFEAMCQQIQTLFDKLTALRNRELLHALYAHMWEMKEVTLLLRAWVRWRQSRPKPGERFSAPEFVPKLFRGGLAAAFERLAPLDEWGRPEMG